MKASAMIFVTVGTQLPFDRLVGAVNDWATENPGQTVLAQTGLGRDDYAALTCQSNLDQTEFRAALEAADVVVAHAGMGSILMAAEAGKPIIIMPRRADMAEHRNDHQRDTAAKMASLSNVHVVETADELSAALTRILSQGAARQSTLTATAQPQLLATLRDFIWAEARQPANTNRTFLRRVAS
jgi:UDP-N-acetylglucosamine transferase subunit ALG13